jgi:hypothetical protein
MLLQTSCPAPCPLRPSPKFFHDRVVERWPELLDLLISPCRVDAVGEEDDRELAPEVHPEGGTGEPQVADGLAGEVAPGTRANGGRGIEAEGPGIRRIRICPPEKLVERLSRPWEPHAYPGVGPDDGIQDAAHVGRGAEKTGVTGHAAKCVSVLVVDLAAQHSAPPRAMLGGGKGPDIPRGTFLKRPVGEARAAQGFVEMFAGEMV